jgi:DNA primase
MANVRIVQIKNDFDWAAYVEQHFTYKTTGDGQYRINCPSCLNQKYKCYVSPAKKAFHCFTCDFTVKKFDLFDFVAKTEGITRAQAVMRLMREYVRTTPPTVASAVDEALAERTAERPTPTIRTLGSLPNGCLRLTEPEDSESKEFWRYLEERGLSKGEITAGHIHYVPRRSLLLYDDAGKLRGDIGRRVVFPVYGGEHRLVSWQARIIDKNYKGHDKYLSCPGSDLSKTLWPYVKPYGDTAVLVEGILDCYATRRVPQTSAYATFSKKISDAQIALLKSWGVKNIIVFWDKRDAKKEIISAVEDLKMHFNKVYVLGMSNWPKELDAGDTLADSQGLDKIKEALKEQIDTTSLEYAKWQVLF